MDHAVAQQFVSPASRSLVIVENTPEKLLQKFEHYEAPQSDKASWALRMSDKLAGL
jgi:predicted Rossmann-fold nucleotide-binding protein